MNDFPVVEASKKSISRRSLVHGVGVNDADYVVKTTISGKRYVCSIYIKWKNMMERCYSTKYHAKCPTYTNCTVDGRWIRFSSFREWVMLQDWGNKELDKDILIPGNTVYSPDTCCFVTLQLNSLLGDNESLRGDSPRGVFHCIRDSRYIAKCRMFGERVHIGSFKTAREASEAYNKVKSNHVAKIALKQKDSRIRDGLLAHAHLISNGAAC